MCSSDLCMEYNRLKMPTSLDDSYQRREIDIIPEGLFLDLGMFILDTLHMRRVGSLHRSTRVHHISTFIYQRYDT
jgi:hypothetical protein